MKTILLFPLSNVMGHLARSLALAEALHAQGDAVRIVLSQAHGFVRAALPPAIAVLHSPEMPPARMGARGLIARYEDGPDSDRANLDRSAALTPADKRRRDQRLARMLERDAEIVRQVRPDAIVTDQRVTPALLSGLGQGRLFHVANALGYASFFRRLSGAPPFPLETGQVLVPGVDEIEYGDEAWRMGTSCGPFRWDGWRRLGGDAAPPPPSDVFLFFGSTGNGARLAPWLLRHLPERYRVSAIGSGPSEAWSRPNFHLAPRGELGAFLSRAKVAFCHGGHGTVMECILHRTPMVIFPQNMEQLEIGRRIERLGMGLVVKRPYDQLTPADLADMVGFLGADVRVRASLDHHAALLRDQDGARRAAALVRQGLLETA